MVCDYLTITKTKTPIPNRYGRIDIKRLLSSGQFDTINKVFAISLIKKNIDYRI